MTSARSVMRMIRCGALEIALQPIRRLDTDVLYGYEILLRPPGETPQRFLNRARKAGCLLGVEAAVEDAALRILSQVPNDAVLHMNLHPRLLADVDRLPLMQRTDVPQQRFVFEITEKAVIRRYHMECIRRLRTRFRIALDDAGSGWNGFGTILAVRPDIVKIDRRFIRRYRDGRFRRVILALVSVARSNGVSLVIAEGIETVDQARWLASLGVDAAQGRLFGLEATRYPVVDRYG